MGNGNDGRRMITTHEADANRTAALFITPAKNRGCAVGQG